jgi:hypothetical protein
LLVGEANKRLKALLSGRIPERIPDTGQADAEEARLAANINKLIDYIEEMYKAVRPLAKGELDGFAPSSGNFLASPFKELHANLLHLAWQASRVAQGDYKQRVDFMGDFSDAFNRMIIALDENEKALLAKIDELERALTRITKLERVLPICSSCKKIRVDGGDPRQEDSWVELERYFGDRAETRFSHGLCPRCMAKALAGG